VLDGTYVERKGGGKILTTLLTRLAAQGGPEAAAEVLQWAASKGHDVNAFHYGVVVHAWARQKQWQHALTLVDEMQVCVGPQHPHALQQPPRLRDPFDLPRYTREGPFMVEPVMLLR
jgi:pentatricopeptide repeat protein